MQMAAIFAFIVFMSINEAWRWWPVDLSHCWHYNTRLSKYNECDVTRSQELWCIIIIIIKTFINESAY